MTTTDGSCERTPLLVTVRGEEVQAGCEENGGIDRRDTEYGHLHESSLDNDVKSEPFNITPLIAISFIGLVQPVCFELIFPFINEMIVENGIVDDPEKVGFYSGFIESIFQVMSFLAVLPCSFISDHYGRKSVALGGTIGMAISISFFGMSKTFWMMVATRCIGGTLGGTWSALKVMMAEIYTDPTHRTRAFSTLQIAFRIGQILGQPLGGLLTHPARNLKILGFDTPFWRTYPFSLPCFVAAAFALASAARAYFTLQETLPQKSSSNDQSDQSAKLTRSPSLKSVMTPRVFSVLASIFIMTFVSEIIFALYPLFAFTPIPSGGLGLSEAQIGAHMAVRSAFNIILLFAYTPICARLGGPVRCYKAGMLMWPLAVACLPVLNALARTGPTVAGVGTWTFDGAALTFFALWSLGNLSWPSSQILVIDAAPDSRSLATVNGLAQMVQNLMMAVAPAFVTSLFAFSIEKQLLGGRFVYVVMLGLSALGTLHSMMIKGDSEEQSGQNGEA